MRDLKKNKQLIYYSNLVSESESVDSNGNKTGEMTKTYGTINSYYINVKEVSGEITNKPYGRDSDYNTQLFTCDMSCPIDMNSRLWIGISSSESSNYVVTKIAKSLNSIVYSVKEVNIDN